MNLLALLDLNLYYYRHRDGLPSDSFAHLQRQIDEGQDLQDRRNFEGHVTSSFALLNPEKTHVLMIHHNGFDKWLFPGGHYEGDVATRISALRELTEETGFPTELVGWRHYLDYLAIDIDTHEIPAKPSKNEDAHWHHDFLYLGVALEDAELKHQEEEVSAAKWISLEDALILPDARVGRAVAKIIELVG